MKIKDLFNKGKPVVSFEFFPPKTDHGLNNLLTTIEELKKLGPSFVSMTYGAGGSTRKKTVALVSKIKNQFGVEAAAHLTCVGHTKDEIGDILRELESQNIENIVALRGDPPKGETNFKPVAHGFRYGSELISYIRSNFKFSVAVAGYPEKHPEAATLEGDLENLKRKVDAGGDVVITQLFFNNQDYFQYVNRVRALGVSVPIVPGIMPIQDVDQIKRFTSMCGATIPKALLEKLEPVKEDKEAVSRIGIEYAISQCRELLVKGAPGLHFYTLNRSRQTQEIFSQLKQDGVVN